MSTSSPFVLDLGPKVFDSDPETTYCGCGHILIDVLKRVIREYVPGGVTGVEVTEVSEETDLRTSRSF